MHCCTLQNNLNVQHKLLKQYFAHFRMQKLQNKKKKLFQEFPKIGSVFFCTVKRKKNFFQIFKIRVGRKWTIKQFIFFGLITLHSVLLDEKITTSGQTSCKCVLTCTMILQNNDSDHNFSLFPFLSIHTSETCHACPR